MDKKKPIKKPKLGDIFRGLFGGHILVLEKKDCEAKVLALDGAKENLCFYEPYWLLECYEKIGNIFEGKNNEN